MAYKPGKGSGVVFNRKWQRYEYYDRMFHDLYGNSFKIPMAEYYKKLSKYGYLAIKNYTDAYKSLHIGQKLSINDIETYFPAQLIILFGKNIDNIYNPLKPYIMKLKTPIAKLNKNEQTLVAPQKRTIKKRFSESEKLKIKNAFVIGEFAAQRGAIKAPAKDIAFMEIFKDELNAPQGTNHEMIVALMESWHKGYTSYILRDDKPLSAMSGQKRKKTTTPKTRPTNANKKNNRHNSNTKHGTSFKLW